MNSKFYLLIPFVLLGLISTQTGSAMAQAGQTPATTAGQASKPQDAQSGKPTVAAGRKKPAARAAGNESGKPQDYPAPNQADRGGY